MHGLIVSDFHSTAAVYKIQNYQLDQSIHLVISTPQSQWATEYQMTTRGGEV